MKYYYIILSILVLLISLFTIIPQFDGITIDTTNLWLIFFACIIASIYYDFKNSKFK